MRWTAFWTIPVLVFVAVPVMLLLGTGPAFACSCAPAPESVYYDRAEAVFAGRLVHREEPSSGPFMSSTDTATLTFEVSRVYKGDVGRSQLVATAQSGASCGLEIEGPGPFLVFAAKDGAGLTASLCDGTRPLKGDAATSFGPGTAPAPHQDVPGVGIATSAAEPGGPLLSLFAASLFAASLLAGLGAAGWAFARHRRGRSGS